MLLVFVSPSTPAWAASLPAEPLPPLDRPATSVFSPDNSFKPRIEIARVRSGLLPGVMLGGHYEGILKVLQQRYTASSDQDERLEQAARQLVVEELQRLGYGVVRSPQDSLFEDQLIDEPEPARFLLGGTITQAHLNSYGSLLGEWTNDQRSIRWEVFDREAGKVIYQQETSGSARAEGRENLTATYEAIRASLQTFLTEPEFLRLLDAVPATALTPVNGLEIAATPSASQPLTIEQIASQSIASIVRVRNAMGRGSGFLLDASGLIVTNYHVVDDAFSVKVDLYDGSTHLGRVLKRDPAADLALVKLDKDVPDIKGLPLCQAPSIKVGEAVVAIGNPLSLTNTVTQGIVSGIRTIAHRTLIQTDTAVNPGNSGGPLFNQYGEVIGIVTEKVSSRGVEGLGFALPIGESLQRLNVKVISPQGTRQTACGNPVIA